MEDSITADSFLETVAHAPSIEPARPPSLAPRYEIVGVLGEGGFGVVYDVFDDVRGRHVALKTLRGVDASRQAGLKREFRALVDVRHRNLVRLHELFGEGDDTYFTMERVEGGVPFDVWARRGERELREALAQVLCGLSELHRRGLVHRDIKPSNVLVASDGRVVLVDFGLARQLAPDDETQPAGTPRYMAPEQCGVTSSPGSAVDAYALGVMLFESLTGEAPFDGDAHTVARAKRQGRAPSVLSVRPDAPRDLASMVDALLATDPAARPTIGSLLFGEDSAEHLGSSAFVGREEALAELERMQREGAVRFVEIVGPSGIGKTALMERFVSRLPNALVLRGRCHPREDIAYKVLDAVMDQLAAVMVRRPELSSIMPRDCGALCRLFPVLRPFAPSASLSRGGSREQGLAACRELFERLADRVPVVLAVDDLQWGDADSAALLVELLREPEPPRLLLVGTRRSDELGDMMACFDEALQQSARVERGQISLGALSEAEALALARSLIEDDARARRAAEHSEGRPLFIHELALSDEASTLGELIAQRVGRLPAGARRVLDYVSVAGYPLSEGLLRRLGDDRACEELVESRLVGASPEGMRPLHDRVGEVVDASLEPSERRALNLRLAEALMELDGDAQHIGDHLARAGDGRAPGYLLQAAREAAASFGFRKASVLYEDLLSRLERAQSVSASARELQEALARALSAAGEPRRAAAAFVAAAELAETADERRSLRCAAAQQLALKGDVERAWEIFNQTFRAWGIGFSENKGAATMQIASQLLYGSVRGRFRPSPTSRRRRARLDALWDAFGALVTARPFAGMSIAARYVAEARSVDDPLHRFRAEAVAIYAQAVRSGAGGGAERRARLARAYARTDGASDRRAELSRLAFTSMVDCYGLRAQDSVGPAQACWDLAIELGDELGFEGLAARALLASAFQILGDVPSRHALAVRMVAEGEARDHPTLSHLGLMQHWAIALYRHGLGDEVNALERACFEAASAENDFQSMLLRWASVVTALAAGEPDRAYALHTRGLKWAARAFAPRLWSLQFNLNFKGQVAVARAARPGASMDSLEVAKRVRDILGAEPSPDTLAQSLALDAGIVSVRRRDDATRRALEAVSDAAESAGNVMLLAIARLELGTMDRDASLKEKARAFFDASGIDDPIYTARTTLPGVFHVTGMRG